jgi:hypothetical protein
MENAKSNNMQILKKNQMTHYRAGNQNICAALAGATLSSAILLNGAGFMFFGAGYLIFCAEGHG